MESQLLLASQFKTPERSASTDSLIREWLFRFGVEHKEDVAPRLPLWLEAFGGMDPATLEFLFRKALRCYKYFPKISEILEPLQAVKKAALPEEASAAWQEVLSIRRQHFNPDFPRHLARAVAELPERMQRAASASGVFREVSDPDQLHIWAKKSFIESYLGWEKIEENQFLLPDGELKNALAGVAALKALPSSISHLPESIPYTPAIAAAREIGQKAKRITSKADPPLRGTLRAIDAAELERQKQSILQKYPTTGNVEGIPEQFRPVETGV